MQTIVLDIQRPGVIQTINAKADDAYSRFFIVALYDGGMAYSPPAGAAYMLRYKTPGGQGWYDTVTQGGVSRAACIVSGNAVTCEIAPEVLAVAGTGVLCLQIYSADGYKLGAWNIPVSIQADPVPDGTIINGDYYSTLTQQVAQALAFRDASAASAAAAAQSAEALANVYTKTQADAAFLPQTAKGAADGVMKLPATLPGVGKVLTMAAGGTVAGVDSVPSADDAELLKSQLLDFGGGHIIQDALNIDTTNPFSDTNARHWGLYTGVGTPVNYPPGLVAGVRHVIPFASDRFFVIVFEVSPNPGKIRINVYGDSTWTGWKSLTPS